MTSSPALCVLFILCVLGVCVLGVRSHKHELSSTTPRLTSILLGDRLLVSLCSDHADANGVSMSDERDTKQKRTPSNAPARGKLPYQKPAFRHEGVFETMALACGKIQSTQSQCHSNIKNS